MKNYHYSTKYGYIDDDNDEQTGKGILNKIKPLLKIVGKQVLKGAAHLAGNKLGSVIADKLSSKAVNYQPDTMLAIAQNARKKVFEDLNIIPKKQEGTLLSLLLTTKVLNSGFTPPPPKINHMMVGNGANISNLKKKKILTKMKFFK